VQEDGEIQRIDPFGNSFSFTPVQGIPPAAAVSLEASILLFYDDRHLELIHTNIPVGAPEFVESLRGWLELPSPPLAAAVTNTEPMWKDEAAVLLADGRVALLSLEKMELLWTETTHIRAGEFAGKPAELDFFFDERGIYVLTKTGATGFAHDGRRLWAMRLRNAAALPSFGDDGILYSGGSDWILYAYRLEDRGRERQRLLYGETPDGSYGTGNPEPSSYAGYYFRFEEAELEARLEEIRAAIRNGNVGSREKEYAAWLMETSGNLLSNPRRPGAVQVRYRMEAAKLLAYIGSRETIPFLAELFSRDPDFHVKAAAAEAIGMIGVDPEGVAMRAFESAIYPPFPVRDEALLISAAASIGALCRFSGPPLSDAGVRLLITLQRVDKPQRAQRQAQREVASLRN
jgi:outer membrane protein assembly factor BamB